VSVRCPVCGRITPHLIGAIGDPNLIRHIRKKHRSWDERDGACPRCVDLAYLATHDSSSLVDVPSDIDNGRLIHGLSIPPTPRRVDAVTDLTGKGITIALIDSGFYPHPDLIRPGNRILATIDVTRPEGTLQDFSQPVDESWHGTMTSVVCAGNGHLSGGYYRSIAPDANLVLVKVHDGDRITGESIEKALRWVIAHKERYGIRIVNLSVTDDWPVSYKSSAVDRAAEEAVEAGLVVVAAVGNNPSAPVRPPANSPNVLAIGGVNDHNTLSRVDDSLYDSTFGTTVDGFLKPDLIAPAIWIAAPILPDTPNHLEARFLFDVWQRHDPALVVALKQNIGLTKLPKEILSASIPDMRKAIRDRIVQARYITPNYQHSDGTSFAAPIVCSVAAQLLEAAPHLTPAAIREILVTTTRRLPGLPVERQGHGVLMPRAAVERTKEVKRHHPDRRHHSPEINPTLGIIRFYYHDHAAQRVVLCGSFNGWRTDEWLLHLEGSGRWTVTLPIFPHGKYAYKFLVDHSRWVDDPRNPFSEPDGFNGLNSVLMIE
jgi:serine protease AprX